MAHTLKAKKRDLLKKKVAQLRSEGEIPAVIYVPEVKDNVIITVSEIEFTKIYEQAGTNTVVDLTVEGEKEPRPVIIKATDVEPVKDNFVHADFYQFKVGVKIDVTININLVGVSNAIKNLSGILMQSLNSIDVKCFPRDMLSSMDVDIATLETFDDKIYVKDLELDTEKFEILNKLDEVIVSVSAPRVEEKIEVEEKPAEEGGEGAEGEEGVEGEEGKEGEGKPAEGGEKPAEGGDKK